MFIAICHLDIYYKYTSAKSLCNPYWIRLSAIWYYYSLFIN
nr:MAG TPA: hypothetical protein [Caudoviricetes sp.]